MKTISYICVFIFQLAFIQIMAVEKDTITLKKCYQALENNHPVTKQTGIYDDINKLKLKDIQTAYYPQSTLNAQLTHQSDVISIDIDIPAPNIEFEPPEGIQTQYKTWVDIHQTIYDGGMTKNRKILENIQLKSGIQQVKVDLYKQKEQVNNLFFGIMALKKQKSLFEANIEILKERLQVVLSGVENGAVLAVNADMLQVEILNIRQQISDVTSSLSSHTQALRELTGLKMDGNSLFVIPEVNYSQIDSVNRPENKLFEIQKERFEILNALNTSSWRPKLTGFGQIGYGKPGLNMLRDEAEPYYILGAQLVWTPWDWNKTSRQDQKNLLQKQLTENKQDVFEQNISVASKLEAGKIDKLTKTIRQDEEIVKLREKVTKTYSSQLENGVITSAEYIAELNKETLAKIKMEIHKVQLEQAKVNYLYLKGLLF